MPKQINTVEQAVEVLGGSSAVARKFGVVPHAVSKWKFHNRFPPDTYIAISQLLTDAGYRAPPSLWGQREAVNS